MPRVAAIGYLSIDTIEADGKRHAGVPGGAALYAALGARAAGADATLIVAAGEDWSATWFDRLIALGIDVVVEWRPGPTRCARLAYMADTRQSNHHADDAWWQRTAALAPALPMSIGADVLVAGPMAATTLASAITLAEREGVPVVCDTSEAFAGRQASALLALLPRINTFAPSREETSLIMPGLSDDDAALGLATRGCRVLQKRGPDGALAVDGSDVATIAAPPTRVVDATGAGDATVGALAAALAQGEPFFAAAEAALGIGARTVSAIGPVALGLDFARAS